MEGGKAENANFEWIMAMSHLLVVYICLLLGKEFLHATKFVNYEKFQTHEVCFFLPLSLPPLVAILCSSLSSSIFHSRGGR